MGLLTGATSLVELILKKYGDDVAGATEELVRLGGFPESVANRIATGELPMDEASRVARREAQTRPETYYHGSKTGGLLEVDPSMSGSERGMSAETGFWGAGSPQRASGYAGNPLNDNSTVYPFRVWDNSDHMIVDGQGEPWNNIKGSSPVSVKHWNEGEENYGAIANWTDDYWDTNDIALMAKDKGDFNSVLFRGIADAADDGNVHVELAEMFPELQKMPYGSKERHDFMRSLSEEDRAEAYRRAEAKANSTGESITVFDPNDIRSPNAAFDPQYTGPNIMGGLALPVTAGLLAAGQSEDADAGFITRGGKTLLEAWHGSPHKFDKFSMDQIGTGEGAQAYGHGLYFADSEDVARGYREDLNKLYSTEWTLGDERVPAWVVEAVENGRGDSVLADFNKRAAEADAMLAGSDVNQPHLVSAQRDEAERMISVVNRLQKGEKASPPGALYRTEIDVTPESLLDWDKPLSEQSDYVKEAFKKIPQGQVEITPNAREGSYWVKGKNWRGGNVNRVASGLEQAERVAAKARGIDLNSQGDIRAGALIDNTVYDQREALSNTLREAGIPGIKYLDGDSRAVGDGTSNYVIFDDSLINIAERGNATVPMLATTAGLSGGGLLAASLAAPEVKDSGMISSPRSETLFDLTMGARDLERRLEGSPASLLFPSGLVEYLETVNRREEDPNAMTRGMALLDVLPF